MLISFPALAVAVLAVITFASRGGRPRVELFFVGYTNRVVVNVGVGPGNLLFTNGRQTAVFLATNSGSRSVKLSPAEAFLDDNDNRVRPAFASHMFGTELKPGRSTTVFSDAYPGGQPFRARLTYIEYGLRDRLSDRWLYSSNSLPRKLGAHLHKKRPVLDAFSEWLTAPLVFDWEPPGSPAVIPGEKIYRTNSRPRLNITAPLPPVDYDLRDGR